VIHLVGYRDITCVTFFAQQNVEDVAPPTVKIARVDNDALVSDLGFLIKLIVNTWSKQLCTLQGLSNVD